MHQVWINTSTTAATDNNATGTTESFQSDMMYDATDAVHNRPKIIVLHYIKPDDLPLFMKQIESQPESFGNPYAVKSKLPKRIFYKPMYHRRMIKCNRVKQSNALLERIGG